MLKKKKEIIWTAIVAVIGVGVLSTNVGNTKQSGYFGIGQGKDSSIVFEVADPKFIRDTMLFLRRKIKEDTVPSIAILSSNNNLNLENDSSVISRDTLTHIKVIKK